MFSLHEWDVGLVKDVEHHICLTDPERVQGAWRLAPADIDDVCKHLQELRQAGIIKETRSQYASAIVIIRKKTGCIRMCIEYRTLIRRTTPDQYTTPRIDDALDCLSGSKWFSVLGFYQFERMPQGITGAPAMFQRQKAVSRHESSSGASLLGQSHSLWPFTGKA